MKILVTKANCSKLRKGGKEEKERNEAETDERESVTIAEGSGRNVEGTRRRRGREKGRGGRGKRIIYLRSCCLSLEPMCLICRVTSKGFAAKLQVLTNNREGQSRLRDREKGRVCEVLASADCSGVHLTCVCARACASA